LPPAVAALRLTSDQLFDYARKKAFERNFNEARSVCRYLLYQNPSYHDVRALLGRTYGWEGQYDQARVILRDVLRRAPFYRDAAIAMIDVETWSGHMDRAFTLADSLWKIDSKDKEVAGRRTSLLQRVGSR
jgi:tetratricopeptide (TPR) repeat protein